ncbi:MAG: gamma-glutamyl-gamma-aminobutyrate hydrolase family protein [archaeon]
MILIINNQSKFIKEFEKTFKKWKVKYKIIGHKDRTDLHKVKNIKGVILSGGNIGLYYQSLINDYIPLINLNVPIIGFCMGHELIGVVYGGAIKKLKEKQDKIEKIFLDKKDPLFKGLKKEIFLKEKHVNCISRLPKEFKPLAHSKTCKIEIMKHKKRPIYGFQSHPEVSNPDGLIILKNFLKMCK